MALFNFCNSRKYRLNLCDREKKESSLEFQSLQEAVDQAREELAGDKTLPTSIEHYSSGADSSGWFVAWYPNDISGVYSVRKIEIAASLEDFIKSNL